MAEDLRRESGKVGLTINFSKRKILTNIDNPELITVEQETVEIVQEYKYLGQIMSFKNKYEKELKIRRANAWHTFWAQKIILRGKFSQKTKTKIFNSTVIPVMTYGAQTWAITKKQTHKLCVTQNNMLRRMLQIKLKDHIPIQDVLQQANTKSVYTAVKSLKLGYAGHLAREPEPKWCSLLTFWVPHDRRRRRGRPYTRWTDEINKLAGYSWKNKARNRQEWKRVTEAYARKGNRSCVQPSPTNRSSYSADERPSQGI